MGHYFLDIWFLYKMVTQNMMRTRGSKKFFFDKNILFLTALDLIKYALKRLNNRDFSLRA